MTTQVLSMQTGHMADFNKTMDPPPAPGAAQPETQPMNNVTAESPSKDEARGRRRTRDNENGDEDGDGSGDGEDGGPPGSRKRRRSRKGLDKKFHCPHEGCTKSYSRAEHLYRHQLNHNPKQIYYCDFPECNRSFVRQDLCARHKERHTARGSQLLRKDTLMHNVNPIVTASMAARNGYLGKPPGNSPTVQPSDRGYMVQSPASAHPSSATLGSEQSPPMDPSHPLHHPLPMDMRGGTAHFNRSTADESYRGPANPARGFDSSNNHQRAPGFNSLQRRTSYGSAQQNRPAQSPHTGNDGFVRPTLHTQGSVSGGSVQSMNMNSPYTASATPTQPYRTPTNGQYPPQSPAQYSHESQFNPPYATLPPPSSQTMGQVPIKEGDHAYSSSGPGVMGGMHEQQMENNRMGTVTTSGLLDNMNPIQAIPVFGGEGYSRSPFAMADDFAAWLFNDAQFGPGASPMNYPPGGQQNLTGSAQIGLQGPYFAYDPVVSGYFSQPAPPQHPMAVNSILDTSLPEAALSEEKRQRLLELIEVRFNETDHAPVKKQKVELMEGNMNDDSHVLSLHMMQTYISSYWVHFHPQLPILHRPTFSAATCPDLLLIAIMALGASCLEKSHGLQVTSASSELSAFLAWHLRWEIFMDADFRPPAKLWVFQALLLLEIFEKMYSTRPLHERAHIHHATTLTLMRRGSSLIGRSALDSPPSVKDGKGINGSSHSGATTPDEWWNHWVTNEATRRAAFAAFVMDSIHATMFGHSAVMVAHEMRLPLPCDEALWSATSGAEVGRVEQSLHQNGIKPVTFLDGLKKTLQGQTVNTNFFGRMILMAGLLSVSWHMNQRDLQVSSLGVTQALGGRDKWRGSLTRAFDFWKRDFDRSSSTGNERYSNHVYQYNALDDDNVYHSSTVLHHLAHMAMHVDIVDCQIFAGANRLLGRAVTPQDYAGAQKRMKDNWAPTARARDATFYALQFLSHVLVRPSTDAPANGNAFDYSARDDFLLNRPWVLYFATLIVWSYGYALDGPLQQVYVLSNHDEKVKDMQGYLKRVGGVPAPDDLQHVQDRNACLGMLILLRDMFKKTRWELLHEAANLLSKCIEMLTRSSSHVS